MSWLQIVPSTQMGIAAVASARSASSGQMSPDVIASLLAAAGLVQIDETTSEGENELGTFNSASEGELKCGQH